MVDQVADLLAEWDREALVGVGGEYKQASRVRVLIAAITNYREAARLDRLDRHWAAEVAVEADALLRGATDG